MNKIDRTPQARASWVGGEDDTAMSGDMQDLVRNFGGDNWVRCLTVAPKTAKRFTDFIASFFAEEGTDMSLRERELIAVAVSRENGCGYCVGHHTLNLGEVIQDPSEAYKFALEPRFANLSEREAALVTFAQKATSHPDAVSEADINAMRDAGISDQNIVEALETAGYFNFANRMFMCLGCAMDERVTTR